LRSIRRCCGGCGDSLKWTPDLAYAVGRIATDRNLSRDGRHLAIPSKDYDLLVKA